MQAQCLRCDDIIAAGYSRAFIHAFILCECGNTSIDDAGARSRMGAGGMRIMKYDNPICYFCQQPNVTDEDHCFGCGAYICADCDNEAQALGAHTPEEHLDTDEYDDEDDEDDV